MRVIIDLKKESELERAIALYLELFLLLESSWFHFGQSKVFGEIEHVTAMLQRPDC